MTTRERVQLEVPEADDVLPLDDITAEVESSEEEGSPEPTAETDTSRAVAPTPSGTASPGIGSGEPVVAQERPRPVAAEADRQNLLLQQRIQELEVREQQRDWEQLRQKHQDELRAYTTDLEQQGLEPAQIQRHVKSLQELQSEREQLHTDRITLQRNAQLAIREQETKLYFAQEYSKQYGVPVQELLKASHPLEMENMGLKAQAAQAKQGKLKPTLTDNNRATPSVRGNRNARIEQLTTKSQLSDKEFEELGNLMGR